MKTIKLLATLLLVALSTGFYSCNDEDSKGEPLSEVLDGSGDSYREYGIDVNEIDCESTFRSSKDRNNFSGLKNNHLWISTYDRNTKEKIFEWTDTRIFERNRRVHMGYGEYKDVTLTKVLTLDTKYKDNNLIATIRFEFGEGAYHEYIYIFKSSNHIKEIVAGNSGTKIMDWYKESIFIGDCLYNNLGDTLFVMTPGTNIGIPISYEEGISANTSRIARQNCKFGITVWSTNINPPFEVLSNTKEDITLLDNSTNIWKYRVDYIFYDGTKKDYTFDINIETGAIIGKEQPISLANLKGTWDMTKCYGWEYNDDDVKEDWTEDVVGEYIFFEGVNGKGGYNNGHKTYYFASSTNGNKLILKNSDWLNGKSVTITRLTSTELYITATDEFSEENYEMKRR